jgi:hypothetical protein
MVARIRTTRRRIRLLSLAVAVLALLGAACHPTASLDDPFGTADPRGSLELVEGAKGSIRVAGWASHGFVGDAWQPVGQPQIAVLVDTTWVPALFPANLPRPDVDQAISDIATAQIQTDLAAGRLRTPSVLAYRDANGLYGFDSTVRAGPGEHTVCVVVLNADWGNFFGEHVLLGCRTVTVT